MICLMEHNTDPINQTIEEWHPMLLSTIANANDNPTYHQAMNGPDRQGYQGLADSPVADAGRTDPHEGR